MHANNLKKAGHKISSDEYEPPNFIPSKNFSDLETSYWINVSLYYISRFSKRILEKKINDNLQFF